MSDPHEYRGGGHFEPIDRTECLLLLGAHAVGRLGITVRGRPLIYPVNYAVRVDALLFRTRQGSDMALGTDDRIVAFEIDGVDNLYHEGWSVLVVGNASHVSAGPDEPSFEDVHLTPWAEDDRDLFVRIDLDWVTGRRINHRGDLSRRA